jgi:hypothetical protein
METKDILSLSIASIGAALGVFNFIKDNVRERKKLMLDVFPSRRVHVPGGGTAFKGFTDISVAQKEANGGDLEIITFEIVNDGRSAVYLDKVGLISESDGGIFDFTMSERLQHPELYPLMLPPGGKRYIHGLMTDEARGLVRRGFITGFAELTNGKRFTRADRKTLIREIFCPTTPRTLPVPRGVAPECEG